MYVQGTSFAEIAAYLAGAIFFLAIGVVLTVRIIARASGNPTYFMSKSSPGTQAVVFNFVIYYLAMYLIVKCISPN